MWYAALGGLDLVNYYKKLAIIPNRLSQYHNNFERQNQATWHHLLLMPTHPNAHVQSYAPILVSSEAWLAEGVHLGVGLCVLLFLNRKFRPKKGSKWDVAVIYPWLPATPPRPPQHLSIGSMQGSSSIIHGYWALAALRGESNMRAQMDANRPFSGLRRKDTKNRTRCATSKFLPQWTLHNRLNDVVIG